MGSYNEYCVASRLPIEAGDHILLVVVRKGVCGKGTYDLGSEQHRYCRESKRWTQLNKEADDAMAKIAEASAADLKHAEEHEKDPNILIAKQGRHQTVLEEVKTHAERRANERGWAEPPYVLAEFGKYNDYGWIEDTVMEVPDLESVEDYGYHFFVRREIFQNIVQLVRRTDRREQKIDWPSEFDRDLADFLSFCHIACIQVMDTERLLGCQFVEPETIQYMEQMNRWVRIHLHKLLKEECKTDFNAPLGGTISRMRALRVPLTIKP